MYAVIDSKFSVYVKFKWKFVLNEFSKQILLFHAFMYIYIYCLHQQYMYIYIVNVINLKADKFIFSNHYIQYTSKHETYL